MERARQFPGNTGEGDEGAPCSLGEQEPASQEVAIVAGWRHTPQRAGCHMAWGVDQDTRRGAPGLAKPEPTPQDGSAARPHASGHAGAPGAFAEPEPASQEAAVLAGVIGAPCCAVRHLAWDVDQNTHRGSLRAIGAAPGCLLKGPLACICLVLPGPSRARPVGLLALPDACGFCPTATSVGRFVLVDPPEWQQTLETFAHPGYGRVALYVAPPRIGWPLSPAVQWAAHWGRAHSARLADPTRSVPSFLSARFRLCRALMSALGLARELAGKRANRHCGPMAF